MSFLFLYIIGGIDIMIRIHCGVKFEEGVQVECDTIRDFTKFINTHQKHLDHNIRLSVKEVDCILVLTDEYNQGLYTWSVVVNEEMKQVVPLDWVGLEEYK